MIGKQVWSGWLPLLAYMTAIYHYSTVTIPHMPHYTKHQDKIVHLGAYLVMSLLWIRVLSSRGKYLCLGLSIGLATAFGIFIEFRQIYCNRTFEVSDIVANFLGASLGALAWFTWLTEKAKKTN